MKVLPFTDNGCNMDLSLDVIVHVLIMQLPFYVSTALGTELQATYRYV